MKRNKCCHLLQSELYVLYSLSATSKIQDNFVIYPFYLLYRGTILPLWYLQTLLRGCLLTAMLQLLTISIGIIICTSSILINI